MNTYIDIRVDALRQQMMAKMPKKVGEMSDEEVLEVTSEWMALKNGGTKEQVKATFSSLPAAHVRIQLETLCDAK